MDASERRAGPRLSLQVLVLLLGLMLWTIWPSPRLWTLVAAYGVAWLLLCLLPIRPLALTSSLTRARAAVLGVLVLAAALAALYRQRDEVATFEGFRGLRQHTADRLRLESLPSIAPPVLFTDHPQSFYVHAPGARQVAMHLPGESDRVGRELSVRPFGEGLSLGEGLFRVTYDPRQDGPPTGEMASISVTLTVDGQGVQRQLGVVRPQAHPRWFASDPERGRAATVSEETDEVFVISRQGLERRFSVDDGPTDCVFFDDGRQLAVSHRYSPDLVTYDPATGEEVLRITVGRFQVRLAISHRFQQGKPPLLVIALAGLNPGLYFVDPTSGELQDFVALEQAPDWIAFGPDARHLIVSSAVTHTLDQWTFEGETWRLTKTLKLGRPAVILARSPLGERLYVATTDYRPGGEEHRGNHFIQDQILTVDPLRLEVTNQYLTARRGPRQESAGSINRGVSPMGITARRDGTLLVAFAGTDEVWELDAELARPPKMFWGVDLDLLAPHGVADLGEGFWAASSPAGGSMAVFRRSGEMVTYVGVTPNNDELFSAPKGSLDRQAYTHRQGEAGFYETTRSGISCQSCHLHGDTDHSPHDIGQKPLLHTLTTRGLARTSPYLRDASFPRVRDLDAHLARTLYRGYVRHAEDRGAVLEAFVEGLAGHVNPRLFESRDLEDERAGVAAFVKAQCTLCHAFPALTNLGQHPVRTLFPDYGADLAPTVSLDTPSLLGVHAKSHFLHDGRSHSLARVFDEHNKANRHGDTAALSDDERRALVIFLESL